jgi:hypothetical protein
LRIAWAEIGSNKDLIAGAFQLERVGSIKSRIRRALGFLLEGNFGKGLKDGREWTQFVVHIEAVEVLETIRQAQHRLKALFFEYLSRSRKRKRHSEKI